MYGLVKNCLLGALTSLVEAGGNVTFITPVVYGMVWKLLAIFCRDMTHIALQDTAVLG